MNANATNNTTIVNKSSHQDQLISNTITSIHIHRHKNTPITEQHLQTAKAGQYIKLPNIWKKIAKQFHFLRSLFFIKGNSSISNLLAYIWHPGWQDVFWIFIFLQKEQTIIRSESPIWVPLWIPVDINSSIAASHIFSALEIEAVQP